MMTEFFSSLLNISTLVFAVSSMLSVGTTYKVRELIGPLRNVRLVIGALVANFVLVPLLAFAILAFLSIGQDREIGLILVASAAGAPFVIILTKLAGSHVPTSSGLLVLLLLITIVYMPGVVPLIIPGITVRASNIAWPLILTMLLPLLIGLAFNALAPAWARHLPPILGPASIVALVAIIVSTILAFVQPILGIFGTGAILAALIFTGGAFAIGYLLGMPRSLTGDELGLVTAQRNIAAAMVVATQTAENPDTVSMVVITSLVALAALFLITWALRKRAATSP
jgi:BASS family bile acid:Na+ symporter